MTSLLGKPQQSPSRLARPTLHLPLGSHPSPSDSPFPPVPSGPVPAASSVVSESTVSWAAGALAVLRCQSPRMVWTQDRLHDRQRVVHWDLSGRPGGGPTRRLVDMYSAGEQRVYEPRDRGRLLLPLSAFHDGNFSLLIRGKGLGTAAGMRGPCGARAGCALHRWAFCRVVAVEEADAGLYTCNLHHHYCHLYETLAVRLEVTDNRECAPPPPPGRVPAGSLPAPRR